MGSGKPERHSKTKEKKGLSLRNPSKKINLKKKTGINKKTDQSKNEENQNKSEASTPASASQQLSFFINEFQSANGVQLSSIELESIKGISFLFFSFFIVFVCLDPDTLMMQRPALLSYLKNRVTMLWP